MNNTSEKKHAAPLVDNPNIDPIRQKYMRRSGEAEYYISLFLYHLRKMEYYMNNGKNSFLNKFLVLFHERRKNHLGNYLGFSISPNCFDEGLTIFHHGCIIVNPNAKIGKGCKLHGNNCIGNNGKDGKCPRIGNNADIGFGAVIIGDISIADDITIGANAVVNKSFTEKGITIAGVPAKKIS